MRKPLMVAIPILIALTGSACNRLMTNVDSPLPLLPDEGKSRSIKLTNETDKPLDWIEFAYSSPKSSGSMKLQGSEALAKPDRHNLTTIRTSGPMTIERLVVTIDGKPVLIAENKQVEVPGDLEIVLKADLSVDYRALSK